jgi:hypothetical protein
MEILFSAKVPREGTKVRVLLLCPDCREELEMAKDRATVRFRCGQHGELGTLSLGEFSEGLQQAQKTIAEQHGLGKLVRIRVTPSGPQSVH